MNQIRSNLLSVAPLLLSVAIFVSPRVHAGLAPQSAAVTIKLRSGNSVEVTPGQLVSVQWRNGAKVETLEGELLTATSSTLTLRIDGARKAIPVSSIMRLTASDAPAASATDGAGSSGTAASAASAGTPAGGASATSGSTTATGGKKHVFVLPMDGTVGIGLRHDEIEQVAAEADKIGPGQIIILKINSNGGLVIEGDDIHVTLKDVMERHQVVSWIEKAISGAAFTALHADKLYFMSHGSLGSITMFAGAESAKGQELEAWLEMVHKVGEIGGRWGHIIKCMVYSPLLLSYDKDPVTGKVTWYDTLEGEFDLSNDKENLDFTAQTGTHSGFIDGVADTEADLLNQLGLSEDMYVLHDEGHDIYKKWNKLLTQAHEEIPLLAQELNYKGSGSGDPVKVIQTRLAIVNKLIQWGKRLGERVFNVEFQMGVEQLEEIREQLQRELRNARSAQDGGR